MDASDAASDEEVNASLASEVHGFKKGRKNKIRTKQRPDATMPTCFPVSTHFRRRWFLQHKHTLDEAASFHQPARRERTSVLPESHGRGKVPPRDLDRRERRVGESGELLLRESDLRDAVDERDGRGDGSSITDDLREAESDFEVVRERHAVREDGRLKRDDGLVRLEGVGDLGVERDLVLKSSRTGRSMRHQRHT